MATCEQDFIKQSIFLWRNIIGSIEAPSKAFLLFFLLPDWLKLNHLESRMECGFPDIFSRHFCSTVAETIGVTNHAASFGAKKCSENHIWSCWDDSRSMEPTNKRLEWMRLWAADDGNTDFMSFEKKLFKALAINVK